MTIDLKFHGRRPTQATSGAAGLDLHADLSAQPGNTYALLPGESVMIPTATFVEIPDGYVGFITPRSGLAAKHGLSVLNSPGTIDSDYRDELKVLLENRGAEKFTVNNLDRIAQLVIVPRPGINLIEVAPADFTDTVRGRGGFGSTGRA